MSKYRSNAVGDGWRDRKGRVWWTRNPENLPNDPEAYGEIPPQFHYGALPKDRSPVCMARFTEPMKAGHRVAELHVLKRRLQNLGPDRKAFLHEDWLVATDAIRRFEDWDRKDGPPQRPRAKPFTDQEMNGVLTYALSALGYDGRGVGLWGRHAGWGNISTAQEETPASGR